MTTLLPLLVPVDYFHLLLGEGLDDASADNTLALHRQYPRAYLVLLDRLVAHDSNAAEYGLGAVVNAIAEAEPTVRQDPRWRRLNEIVARA